MSLLAYCKIQGETQGLITQGNLSEESVGHAWQEGHEDEIMVQSYSQEVLSPHDVSSSDSGHRRNGPVQITKELDKCAPLLHQALATNELLTTVEFTFFRTSATGVQELFFKINLEEAYLTLVRDRLPDTLEAGSARFPMLQDISFVFRKIGWEHVLASTMAEDQWRDPGL